MAFIQQGPRRKLATSTAPDRPSLDASAASATTSFHSLESSTASTATFATTSDRTTGASAQPEASQDWSLVFPGRPRIDRSVSTLSSTSQHDNRTNEDSSSLLVDASTTLIPLHDGTGTFANYDEHGLDPLHSPTQGRSEADNASTQGSDDTQAIGAPAFDLVFDDESASDSSGLPPSLTLSPGANAAFRERRRGARSSQLGSEASEISSAALLFSPTSSSAVTDDILDAVPNPEWSWEDQGEHRVLAATTPRQGSPTRLSRSNLSRVAYASDSESESGDASRRAPAHSRPEQKPTKPFDSVYEDALADAPSAASAGLLPRRRDLRRGSIHYDVQSDVPPSGSQFSSSLGFKRRQRRQHKEGSVRSSKSRRSDSLAGISGAGVSVRSSTHRRHRRHDTAPGDVVSGIQQTGERSAASATSPVGLSKKAKVARLFGRLLNVDNDVLDALLHDQGPLALTDADRTRDLPPPTRRRSFGFEHESAELGHETGGTRRWRELIDGRIVEDLEGEEEEEDAQQSSPQPTAASQPQPSESQDAASATDTMSSRPADPILALTSATLSAHETNDAGKLQELIRYALARMGPDAQANAELLAHNGITDGNNVDNAAPGSEQALSPALTPAAILSSTADALQGVMPYFVPFSWRLLVRLMKEWNQGEAELPSHEPAGTATTPKVDDAPPSHAEEQQPTSTAPAKTRSGRTTTTSPPTADVARGRSTERKSLGSAIKASGSSSDLFGVESLLTTSSASTTRG